MSKLWEKIKELYSYLDGNKTIIGTTLLAILNVPAVSSAANGWYIPIVTIITLLTGVSAYDHIIKKKSFTKNYK